MTYPTVAYVKVQLDRETQPGQWYLWPEGCPMMAAKRAAGHPAPMACMGGMVATHDRLSIFTTCWHTHMDEVHWSYRQTGDDPAHRFSGYRVGCSYDPDRDGWDHPGEKIGEPREPQTSEPPPGAAPGDVVRAFLMPPATLTAPKDTL